MDDDPRELAGPGDVTDIAPPSATAAGTPDVTDEPLEGDPTGSDAGSAAEPMGVTDSGGGPAGGAGSQTG